LRRSLREAGYVEGQNVTIEWRNPEGKPEHRMKRSGFVPRPLSVLSAPLLDQGRHVFGLYTAELAHAPLRIAYHVLAHGTTYRELGGDYYDRHHVQRLTRRAIRLLEGKGYRVTLEPAA
jgi:hypothetical protein